MLARAVKRQYLRGYGDVSSRAFSKTAPAKADFTHVVIGGGVIGLATARALASSPTGTTSSTLLLERHGQIGTETSSRNSEVIHAGIYYGASSLKAHLCIRGKHQLYALCSAHGIPHRRTGKWIVAQDASQREILEEVHRRCRDEIDVPTRWVSRDEAGRLEPNVRAEAGVVESPTTGIVDSHRLMVTLQGLFEDAGGVTALNSRVDAVEPLLSGGPGPRARPGSGGWRLTVTDAATDESSTITTETLINSAGLGAVDLHNAILSSSSSSLPKEEVEARKKQIFYAKGNYFSYSSSRPRVSRLVYPVTTPGSGGLGTHLTLDMAGRIRFGPDVEWVSSPTDLDVNTSRFPQALDEIRKYLPGIDESALAPDYAGIRPKLAAAGAVGSGSGFVDFYVKKEKGFEGWINLLGMESPGLTSALAVGEHVRDLLYASRTLEEV